ncbi:MAG: Eco57I restriction-modification methylase domain-containing protein [Luteibacter sp.]|uniref:HsdM family class I SAM-dependent methyltransferase n=1 Tax=Luteibacter sp. TaxID=1886636 RepID=UPI002808F391|nr:Eco57I restriction-modification methylase domain-containing protein [Luteibacter sp.]MDQ7994594.1 Eco57I restriction-modification methylase domain-containing protein [Luteibacter sp.]
MRQTEKISFANPEASPLERYMACKAMARGYAEGKKTDKTRLAHARAFCAAVLEAYWAVQCKAHGSAMKAKPAPQSFASLPAEAQDLAEKLGELVSGFPVEDAGFLVGSIYTVMLPDALRSSLGAFYTPPPLVSRLLDLAEEAGFDFASGSATDPACGGGAFLAPVALRMVAAAEKAGEEPSWILARLGKRLAGAEIDPFAAWMTRVLLDAALIPLCKAAGRRLPDVVRVGDSLQGDLGEGYDLVVGNPPYGRVTLSEDMRATYARSLYGHANLYGLFTDLALRLARPGGVVAYLTPTSFLGGQYFKELRRLLTTEARPVAFDLVADRDGVFDDVLQETLLTTYRVGGGVAPATVSLVIPKGLNAATVRPLGPVALDTSGDPWLLPRSEADAAFMATMAGMVTRLADVGYAVSTGPLVWNRHKDQLRTKKAKGLLPIIWAESVTGEGFAFAADRRGHVPFIELKARQDHLVDTGASILVQRTTSKEQARRIIAAVMPQDFIDRFGGAVVENHLNRIVPTMLVPPAIRPETLAVVLNTEVVDRAFRCISGSVAVSAYELNAIPLPSINGLQTVERMLKEGAPLVAIERKVASFYGLTP